MITQKESNVGGLALAIKHRKAGSMEREGKIITWNERHQVVILTFEGDSPNAIRKYSISPSYQEEALKVLEDIHWGALIELELSNREVVSVVVVNDALADFYEEN